MLSREQREIIEREAADQIRAAGSERNGPVASAMVDIRHKVVEEGWYGRQVTDNGFYEYSRPQGAGIHGDGPTAEQGAGIHGNQASSSDIYGHAAAQSPTAGVSQWEVNQQPGSIHSSAPAASQIEPAEVSKASGVQPPEAEKKQSGMSM